MLRGLFRLVLLLVIVVGVGAFLLGYRLNTSDNTLRVERDAPSVGTTGGFDADKAREKAARLGEKAAVTANTAAKALDDGTLTAKIKAKMTLDDFVKARNIDVDTTDGVVTLTGRVHSSEERTRALKLAGETSGVRGVKDQLTIR